MSEKNFPAVPASAEPQARVFLSFVRRVLLGLAGGSMERAVTFKDLTDLGLIDQKTAEKQARK